MTFYTHNIDPTIFSLGVVEIRWYGVAYVVGIVLAWLYGKYLIQTAQFPKLKPAHLDDFIVWATLGIIFGGRIGDILFYHPQDLWKIWEYFYIWIPGRSFHGGLLGVVLTTYFYCRKKAIPLRSFGDLLALITPIGLFFGRLSNFINGELWGRSTRVPWAVIFPEAGPQPRHPSQLYEALGEGIILFFLLYGLSKTSISLKRPGTLSGTFLIGYALARIIVEFFREPDAHIGYFFNFFTMGQLLSLPLLGAGIVLILTSKSKGDVNG